jgi:hypothetical protein
MADQTTPNSVKFFYLKSNFFRVVHVDGCIGGLTPSRHIFVSLYNQRGSLPDMTEQQLSVDGTLGREIRRRTEHDGVIREIEVGLVLEATAARELAQFLLERAELLDRLTRSQAEHTDIKK